MNKTERKHSQKRDAILELIRSTGSHPSARWVYEQLKSRIPHLSLGTVYRNINFFREEGTVASLGVVDNEERFDGDVSPHPHCVCRRCGAVIDLPAPEKAFGETLETIAAAEGPPGFIIDRRRTVFYGVCGNCRDTSSRDASDGGADSGAKSAAKSAADNL
jgi:Fur family peroxide stress response transcriptional regulator